MSTASSATARSCVQVVDVAEVHARQPVAEEFGIPDVQRPGIVPVEAKLLPGRWPAVDGVHAAHEGDLVEPCGGEPVPGEGGERGGLERPDGRGQSSTSVDRRR